MSLPRLIGNSREYILSSSLQVGVRGSASSDVGRANAKNFSLSSAIVLSTLRLNVAG